MKLIDADKLIEKLSAGLDNPEELPVISIGTVMRMIDGEEEIHTSQPEPERTMEEFMYGQDMGNPEDGSL